MTIPSGTNEIWLIVFTMPDTKQEMAATTTKDGLFALCPISKDGVVNQAIPFESPKKCREFMDALMKERTEKEIAGFRAMRPHFRRCFRPN